MITIREKYWRYSLFVLILGLATLILLMLRPYWGGLLGAMTLYVLLRTQMEHLVVQRKWSRGASATLLMIEAVVCFLVPLSLMVWLIVDKMHLIITHPHTLIDAVHVMADHLQRWTSYDLLRADHLATLLTTLSRWGQLLLQELFNLGVNILVLLFALYFLLIGGFGMEEYCRALLPFDRAVASRVMHEIHTIVRSNAVGIPLIALAQGSVAYVGYLIAGLPDALVWALLTSCATVLPVVGASMIWFPLSLYLVVQHHWGAALFLLLYGVLIITQSDNVVRSVLLRRMAHTHPVVTILGVLLGLPLFGFMGIIFGPLLLSLFLFCVHLFKHRYIDRNSGIS